MIEKILTGKVNFKMIQDRFDNGLRLTHSREHVIKSEKLYV
ncbi:hypothetical protein BWGOE2_32640 [Bacillus mycoides]|nr:hypothetical protein BWGOE2_32640 [Bacillus mycoides]OFD49652.1 hypothetical protein BWGOE1_09360 [Bacillus mycoides]CAH2461753.1 hypothetical protein ACOSJ1_EBGNOMHC_02837 [Bacillus mycoides KBAB4]